MPSVSMPRMRWLFVLIAVCTSACRPTPKVGITLLLEAVPDSLDTRVALSSDAPVVEDDNPLAGMQAA